jgi:type II secretory pathway component HofQ
MISGTITFMKRFLVVVLAIGVIVAPGVYAAGQALETYHAKHRAASELVSIARAAMGDEGEVILDSRTALLVLNGTPNAVRRALAILEELDRPLRHVILTHQVRDQRDLDLAGVGIEWEITAGSVRIGTLPLSGKGLRVALGAHREGSSPTSGATLRLLEGGTGLIVTGEALPFVYDPFWGNTAFVPAETGFEAVVSIQGDRRVRLDLRPFAGRVEGSRALHYTMASTSLVISPGETVVVGGVSRESVRTGADLRGAHRDRTREKQVLIVSGEVGP